MFLTLKAPAGTAGAGVLPSMAFVEDSILDLSTSEFPAGGYEIIQEEDDDQVVLSHPELPSSIQLTSGPLLYVPISQNNFRI